ncbi:MAG TPA: hypothetical protein PKA58_01075 [Polyangium sp.]|nr:hypothetical protein [Polyangium sp.]
MSAVLVLVSACAPDLQVSQGAGGASGAGGQCPECSVGAFPDCKPDPYLTDDCDVPGELCNEDGKCECGLAPTSMGTCPAVNGWQSDGKGGCLRTCGPNECSMMQLVCPAGFDCTIECGAVDSCRETLIYCPANYHCEVVCTAADSCRMNTIQCSDDGPCRVGCGAAGGACHETVLICGDNSCAAFCDGPEKPSLVPNTSCNAKGC